MAFRTSRARRGHRVWRGPRAGGDVLFIEASLLPGGKEQIILTGQLGSVMQESARAAVSHIRVAGRGAGHRPGVPAASGTCTSTCPAGAIPKDGPSAGVTMATAILSAATGRAVREDVAMTGEITLSGLVLPVGGIREKALAARRMGIETVILPALNEPDLVDIPEELRRDMTFVFAKTLARRAAVRAAAGRRASPGTAALGRPSARARRRTRDGRSSTTSRATASATRRDRSRSSMPLLARAARSLPVHIRTAAPRWLFDLTVRGPFTLTAVDTDPGVVQHDSLSLDAAETVRRATRLRGALPELAAARSRRAAASSTPAFVVADIPPLGLEAARLAGVPAIAIGNFTWDWIYRDYPGGEAAADAHRRGLSPGRPGAAAAAGRRLRDLPPR